MMPYGDQKDGRFMTRDEKGNASVITEGDLQLKEFAKTYGTTVGEVLANNGTAKGKETTMMIGGKPTKVRSSTDFATRQTSLDYLPGATPEQYAKHEQEIGEFLAVYSSDDNNLIKKNAKVQAVVDMEKAGIPFDQIAEKILKPQYGMNFVKLPKAGFIHNLFTSNDTLTKEGYATSDKVNIAYFPGEKDVLRTPDGGSYPVYYEKSDDSVYSPIGIKLGTPLEAVNKIMAEEEKKRKAKEQEDTFKKIEDEMDEKKYGTDKSSLPLETRRPMGYYGGQKFFD